MVGRLRQRGQLLAVLADGEDDAPPCIICCYITGLFLAELRGNYCCFIKW